MNCCDVVSGDAMSANIRFKKQYKPVGFGDSPDSRTVDGMRLAAQRRDETRRLNRLQKEHEQFEQDENGRGSRVMRTLGWWFTHLKFRSWFGR
jgi:hypothetical protein